MSVWPSSRLGAGVLAGEALLGPRFGRREPRARAVGYVRSLMAPLERKNGWTISEATGARSPDSVQWLLTGADWDIPAAAITAWTWHFTLVRSATSFARCRTSSRSSRVAGGAIHPSGH